MNSLTFTVGARIAQIIKLRKKKQEMNEWMDGWVGGRMNRRMDGWTDGRTDGRMDDWMDTI